MNFAKIGAAIAALATVAKAAAPHAAAEIDAAATEAHAAAQETEQATADVVSQAVSSTSSATASPLLQVGEALAEPTVEAFVAKMLAPVFKTNAPAVAAKFVEAGEAAITAL